MSDSDLAIIGAGPAGSLAAWETSRKNVNKDSDPSVLIFEEHKQIGLPTHCSGLVAMRGLRQIGVKIEKQRRFIQNIINRAIFVSPSYQSFEIERNKDSMVVIDRVAFDRFLSDEAIKFGCSYSLGSRVKKIHFNGKEWQLDIVNGKSHLIHKCKVLISAEGIYPQLTRSIGLPTPNKKWLFPAMQYEIANVKDLESKCVELYFGRKYSPGFYGWVIPLDETNARIGIAVSPHNGGNTRFLAKRFIKKHPLLKKRLSKAKVIKTYGGIVPVSGPIERTYKSNFMVIGDAAGQTKATTGGGVNIGGYCGRLAGLMASKIISEELTPTKGCREYHRRWQGQFEPELSIMKLFRRMMTPLTDDTWNEIVQIARDTDIEQRMKNTSIDLHGMSLLKYALTPQVFIKGMHLVPHVVISLLRGLAF